MPKNVILNTEESVDALQMLCDYQNKQREAQVAKTIEMLDPDAIPWPERVVERLSLMNMQQADQVLAHHPGKDLNEIWQSIESLLDIFKLSYEDILLSLDEFQEKAQEANFFSRRRQKEFDAVCLNVNKCIYHLSCTSVAIYNISQEFRGLFAPEGYIENYETCYTNSTEHYLLKAIRNALSHRHFAPANYKVTKIEDVHQTEFCVSCVELLEHGGLRSPDKKYVLEAGKHIKVRPVIEKHHQNVAQFYSWVKDQLKQDNRFMDYQRCKLAPKLYATRTWWSIMMQQIVAKKLDPYEHLDNNFTDEELEEINSLPHRSLEQVDRMIELYDTDGACDVEFRKRIYEFFNL